MEMMRKNQKSANKDVIERPLIHKACTDEIESDGLS